MKGVLFVHLLLCERNILRFRCLGPIAGFIGSQQDSLFVTVFQIDVVIKLVHTITSGMICLHTNLWIRFSYSQLLHSCTCHYCTRGLIHSKIGMLILPFDCAEWLMNAVCVLAHVCTHWFPCACMSMHVEVGSWSCAPPLLFPTVSFEIGFLTDELEWLASQPLGSACLHFPVPEFQVLDWGSELKASALDC